jgi:hypothetical protein
MTVIVKCDWHELGSDGVFAVDPVWIYENCRLERGDEAFIWWHKSSRRPTDLEMRGTLLQFSRLPTTRRPEASLQINVTQRIMPNCGGLTDDDLDENSDIPALHTLWRKLKNNRLSKVAFLEPLEADYLQNFFDAPRYADTDREVEEGYEQDRTVRFWTRNATIIEERKAYDEYQCQSCNFRLEVFGRFVVDCHHKYPQRGVRVTGLDDLVCLCPTCHRIAHTRIPPLSVEEIQAVREANGFAAVTMVARSIVPRG